MNTTDHRRLDETRRAYEEFTEHRHYVYRGCAPDPDNPRRSAADPDLPLDAWTGTTVDGGLPIAERADQKRRAVAICGRCPVLAQCRAYAMLPGGGLAETEGIQAGMTAGKRLRTDRDAAAASGQPAGETGTRPAFRPLSHEQVLEAISAPKRAVLQQLAKETDAELVAYRAGMDVRTANWHRAALCRLFGLDKETASRAQLLQAAIDHRILPARTRIVPDGPWPVVAAPNTDGSRQRRIAPGRPEQTTITGLLDHQPTPTPAVAPAGPRRLTLARTAPATARPVPLLLPVRTPEAQAA
ncbi:WhiB family transcriptional regulator [Streptomyces zaomyceticus]|uniref:WhiB family transcriptional regulator n=1 Tax=Streptomyces zaomyceticus TaxID=68286 RepID=UPI00379529E6